MPLHPPRVLAMIPSKKLNRATEEEGEEEEDKKEEEAEEWLAEK